MYGYRTKRSMKNMNNWKIANAYSSTLMIYLSTAGLILTGILFLLKTEPLTLLYIVFAMGLFIAIAVIVLTEKKLKQH